MGPIVAQAADEKSQIEVIKSELPWLQGGDRAQALISLAGENISTNPDLAQKYATEALEISKGLKDYADTFLAERLLAWIYLDRGETDTALTFAQNGYHHALVSKNDLLIWQARNTEAVIYSNMGLYDLALNLYLENISLPPSKVPNQEVLAHTYNNIGVTYYRLKNWKQAEHYYSKALQLLTEMGEATSIHYCNCAESKLEAGDYENAETYFHKALELLKGNDLENDKALILTGLGDLELRRNNLTLALNYLTSSLEICEITQYNWLKTKTLRHMGQVYAQQRNWPQALKYLEASLTFAHNIQSVSEEIDTLSVLFETQRSAGLIEQALNTHVQYKQLVDSVALKNSQNRALIHKVDLEFSEKERIIQQLTDEKRETQHKLLAYSFAGGLLLVFILFYLILARYRHLAKMKQEIENHNLALRHANQVKDQFLSMIGHEFRTPINEMVGLLSMELKNDIPETTKSTLRTVSASAYKLSGNINDLIDIIKMGSEDQKLQSIEFSITQIIDDTISLNQIRANEKSLVLEKKILGEIPDNVIGDPLRLKQVLNNLTHNAVKFTDTGTVTVKCEAIQTQRSATTFRFSVIDTGIGINPSIKHQLFDRFTQADSTASRRHGGLGLGLSIAKSVLDRMDSSILIASKEGKGSIFSFDVRLRTVDTNIRSEKPTGTTSTIPESFVLNVLLVEDGKVNQKIAKHEVLRLGHQIEIAQNGKEALERLSKKAFDIVLMDIDMPVLNGIEATRRIRSRSSNVIDKDCFICAFTASAMHGDRERFLAEGMNDYVPKPVKQQAFAETFDRAYHYQHSRGKTLVSKTQTTQPTSPSTLHPSDAIDTKDYSEEVVKSFLKETLLQLERIDAAIQVKDAARIRQLSLTIAGSAGYLNQNNLVETCVAMEARAVQNDFEQIEALRKKARRQFAASKKKLEDSA